MVIHPPMLYMGYVGFSVAFAFAIAALHRRPARRDVGALVAALDHARVVLSDQRHHARQLVGVLRARLGRLVVLGSGRERVVHAVARRHRAASIRSRSPKSAARSRLDRAARDLRVLAVAARHVPRALRRAHVGARVRHRSAARRVHPRVPGDRHRRLARALRAAGAEGRRRRPLRRWFRANRCCSPTTCC